MLLETHFFMLEFFKYEHFEPSPTCAFNRNRTEQILQDPRLMT